MTIPTLPPVMQSTDSPSEFSDKGDAWMKALTEDWTPAVNELETNVNTKEVSTVANALVAQGARDQAVSATNAYPWSTTGSSRAFAIEETTIFTDGHSYRCIVATTAGQSPTTNPEKWIRITTTPRLIKTTNRTSNTPISLDENGWIVDMSGTFTQTFESVSILKDGWFCFLRNSGTGDIVIDPDGSETIDGMASFVMYPDECRLVTIAGAALNSIVLNSFSKTFTSSSDFIKPPGYTNYKAMLWSGGASGSKSGVATSVAFGGAGGGCFIFVIPAETLSASETISIGSGGLSVSTITSGNTGGDTSIGNIVTVYAGTSSSFGGSVISGAYDSDTPWGFAGATIIDGYQAKSTVFGGSSSSIHSGDPEFPPYAGDSIYGGCCGGGVSSIGVKTSGGSSIFGGDGGSDGGTGIPPGGGGGGTQTGTQSGAGARGEVRIWGIV